MERKIEGWRRCSPQAMAYEMSRAAQYYAFKDAQSYIIELHEENQRLREILRQIAYPRRGTCEETMSLQDFAEHIKATYTIEQLEGEQGQFSS